MPPKRKKKQPTQKQKQSQRQSVVVNIGKSSTTKRRRNAGRGGLPPPSHQQNLFPPTIIQQQANLGNLENEISRLTAFIQARQPINNLVTPLSSSVNVQPSMSGIKAEERRAGPTASNFQSPPSSENFQPTGDEALAFIQQTLFDEQDRKDFDLKQRQAQPDAEVPFAVVQKGDELLPIVYGKTKPGRPFKNPSSLSVAEPIGPPIADFNKTVNLAQGESLDLQGITSFKQTEPAFVPITKDQRRQLVMLQKRASLTVGEETVKKQLMALFKKSKPKPLSDPFPKAILSDTPPTPPDFDEDFFVADV